jgi:hypothetical protein
MKYRIYADAGIDVVKDLKYPELLFKQIRTASPKVKDASV